MDHITKKDFSQAMSMERVVGTSGPRLRKHSDQKLNGAGFVSASNAI